MGGIIVYGGDRGHGKCIVDSIRQLNDKTDILIADSIEEADRLFSNGYNNIIVDFAESLTDRKNLILKLKEKGFTFQTVIDPSAQVSATAEIGDGVYVGKAVTMQPEAKVMDYAIIDTGTVIDVGAVVGSYTRIVTGGVIGEGATVGDMCYVDARTVVGAQTKIPDGTKTEPASVYN